VADATDRFGSALATPIAPDTPRVLFAVHKSFEVILRLRDEDTSRFTAPT
jgi:hypothetical protein